MRKGAVLLIVGIVLSAVLYIAYYCFATAPMAGMLKQPGGGLEWLRREFHLTDAQYARIHQLHDSYAPACARMCEKVTRANARLEEVIRRNDGVTVEVQAAMEESAAVRRECSLAMLAHAYVVSAEMSPDQGQRYLEMIQSRLVEPGLDYDALVSKAGR
jgi:hypothetical protein